MSTHTGTGTQATPPSSTTAADLLDQTRVALADPDAETWPDATLLTFLAEAIREYSQHLPRIAEAQLVPAGDPLVALPWDALAVLSVEYPEGHDPAAYLRRLSYKSGRFAVAADAYDFLPRHDLTHNPAILLSFTPDEDETLTVRYTCPHTADLAIDDSLTVPDDHHHVLLQYVLFAAARQLQAAEQARPTNSSSLLMGQLAANTRRLEQSYLNALNRILFHRQGESAVASWG